MHVVDSFADRAEEATYGWVMVAGWTAGTVGDVLLIVGERLHRLEVLLCGET